MKLIVIDLDNTLLKSDGSVSEFSKKCLKKYEELGNLVVLASQKNYGEMKIIHDALELKSPIICEGGSELYYFNDSFDDVVMSIDINVLRDIFSENYDYIVSAFYHYKTNLFLHKRMDIITPLYGINATTKIHENDFLNMDLLYPNMIFTVIDKKNNDKFLANIKKYDDYIELTSLGSDLNYALYYINIKNVDKAYATIEIMLKYQILKTDLIAVGDSIKDVKLLKMHGETVCMINGENEAKEASKYISEFDNNNDGACKAINKILNLNI